MRVRRPTFALLAALALVGCASVPARFYILSPVAEPSGTVAAYGVSVGPVSIPAVVDRPQVVVTEGPNRVSVDELDRWGSPLQSEISRVVAQNLVRLLGTPVVTVFPDATSAGASYRVWVDVMVFGSEPGRSATLDAVWRVRGTGAEALRTGRTSVNEPVGDRSFDALASAHSRALARLSADVADAIRALEAGAR